MPFFCRLCVSFYTDEMEDMVPIRVDAEARDGRQCMMIDYGPGWSGRSERRSEGKARRLSYEAVVREGTKSMM
jgi:hypothetical protein